MKHDLWGGLSVWTTISQPKGGVARLNCAFGYNGVDFQRIELQFALRRGFEGYFARERWKAYFFGAKHRKTAFLDLYFTPDAPFSARGNLSFLFTVSPVQGVYLVTGEVPVLLTTKCTQEELKDWISSDRFSLNMRFHSKVNEGYQFLTKVRVSANARADEESLRKIKRMLLL